MGLVVGLTDILGAALDPDTVLIGPGCAFLLSMAFDNVVFFSLFAPVVRVFVIFWVYVGLFFCIGMLMIVLVGNGNIHPGNEEKKICKITQKQQQKHLCKNSKR